MSDYDSREAPEEFSLYKAGATTVSDIKELRQFDSFNSMTSIRIMHSINLKSLQASV
jgi:hypothetical protein